MNGCGQVGALRRPTNRPHPSRHEPTLRGTPDCTGQTLAPADKDPRIGQRARRKFSIVSRRIDVSRQLTFDVRNADIVRSTHIAYNRRGDGVSTGRGAYKHPGQPRTTQRGNGPGAPRPTQIQFVTLRELLCDSRVRICDTTFAAWCQVHTTEDGSDRTERERPSRPPAAETHLAHCTVWLGATATVH